jgi:hypothetical protein
LNGVAAAAIVAEGPKQQHVAASHWRTVISATDCRTVAGFWKWDLVILVIVAFHLGQNGLFY